jgi:hypothetical protein
MRSHEILCELMRADIRLGCDCLTLEYVFTFVCSDEWFFFIRLSDWHLECECKFLSLWAFLQVALCCLVLRDQQVQLLESRQK